MSAGWACCARFWTLYLCCAVSALWGQFFPPPLRGSTSPLRWSGYVQLRYTNVDNGEDLYGLRRVKLMVGGNLSPRVQWYAQALYKDGNASPTDGRVYFQEGWLRFAFRKEAQLVIGQFKPPFGRERFTPDFQILTIDRSLATDALTPDGPYIDSFYRDRGVQLDGEWRSRVRYMAGIFDGRGANHQFHGIGPLVAVQTVYEVFKERPARGGPLTLQLGGATAFRWGKDLPFRSCCARLEQELRHFSGADRRLGLEASAEWGRVSFRAEYLWAGLSFKATPALDSAAHGWYVQGARFPRPKWQAVCKHERFDPNPALHNDKDIRQSTIGINYYVRQNRTKVMAGYVIRQGAVRPFSNNLFQVQLQFFVH
ncbi:MAG: hypothetical protein HY820_38210 [Acidobacteria bacterium]|nr:hypothetical protein [Acidobacteriota bacterium]